MSAREEDDIARPIEADHTSRILNYLFGKLCLRRRVWGWEMGGWGRGENGRLKARQERPTTVSRFESISITEASLDNVWRELQNRQFSADPRYHNFKDAHYTSCMLKIPEDKMSVQKKEAMFTFVDTLGATWKSAMFKHIWLNIPA